MSDQVLAVPEELVNASLTFVKQAHAILSLVSDLDHAATTENTSLTTKARVSFDDLWNTWKMKLQGLAQTLEALGILLEKSAVSYMKQDSNITQAFQKNPNDAQAVGKKIQSIEQLVSSFDSGSNSSSSASSTTSSATSSTRPQS